MKDLKILWRDLPEQVSGEEQYSSLNTILLDDSALKAHLQPFNHLPIPEYDVVLRNNDLAALDEEQRVNPSEPRQFRFDPSLLAVIGVLDELSRQDSVCAWIRADGLWAGFKGRADDSPADPSSDVTAHNDVTVDPETKYLDKEIAHQLGALPPIDGGANSVLDDVPIRAHKRQKTRDSSKHLEVPPDTSLPSNNLVPDVPSPAVSLILDTPIFYDQDESTPPNTQATTNPTKFAETSHDHTLIPKLSPEEIAPGTIQEDVAAMEIVKNDSQGRGAPPKAHIYCLVESLYRWLTFRFTT